MKRQVDYANEMIELILKMGTREMTYSDFDLALLMGDVATFFQRVSGQGITIKTYVDGSAHLISGCQSLISNSILNLCANAKDAIGENGTIEVSLMRDCIERIDNAILNQNISGKCSVLTVKDTGCGIASDQLNVIFEPFFTTKETTKKANAGLGLANVIYTVREHGANMTVESEVGVGTTFKLYFKAAA
jgi:signal transduction histidine kinase